MSALFGSDLDYACICKQLFVRNFPGMFNENRVVFALGLLISARKEKGSGHDIIGSAKIRTLLLDV